VIFQHAECDRIRRRHGDHGNFHRVYSDRYSDADAQNRQGEASERDGEGYTRHEGFDDHAQGADKGKDGGAVNVKNA
jgi:hypothetical protein